MTSNCDRPYCKSILEFRPPRIALSLLLFAAALHTIVSGGLHTQSATLVAGLAVATVGFLLMLRAWWLFRTSETAICPTADSSVLVTRDVFRLTRNPMYVGMIAIFAGIGIALGSWIVVTAAGAYALILDHTFCTFEEMRLESQFDDAYRIYRSNVPRWF